MCVIVLRTRAYEAAFVVVVILIADIPIEALIQLDSQARFRRLVTHWIRSDQCSWISRRICQEATLSNVLIDSIRRVERNPRVQPGN